MRNFLDIFETHKSDTLVSEIIRGRLDTQLGHHVDDAEIEQATQTIVGMVDPQREDISNVITAIRTPVGETLRPSSVAETVKGLCELIGID